MDKSVEIKCHTGHNLDIENVQPFQGDLKKLTKVNENKLKKKILELGYSEPISIWEHKGKNYILNGHQRIAVLRKMRDDGYSVPEIPVSKVEAKDMKEAKKKVLSLTSQFGEITEEGLFNFVDEAGIEFSDLDSLRLPEIDLEKFANEFGLKSDDSLSDNSMAGSGAGSAPDVEEQYILTIDCKNESTLEKMFEKMKAEGYECKMVT